ncbi:S-layer homology domain-containing protein [Acidaminococcus fermentans]|uniref:S-layer homology domain-containing protein n=1 Tax=Acidaminococcus fermentans TaxID=905 RepID=UPI003F8B157A
MGLALPSGALAADPVDLGNNASAAYDDKGNLTIGNTGTVAEGANKAGKNNTTIGTDTDTLRNVTEGETSKNGQPMDETNDILVKGEGQANDLAISTEADGSTAVGYQSRAEGERSTAIGNTAKITNKPVVYYADAEGKKTTSQEDAAWYKDKDGKPTQVPQVFRDADGNKTTTPQYIHTYTEKDPATGKETTKTEITSDASKADQKDGKPVYNYQKSDNLDKLYSVTLYQSASDSIAAGSSVSANGSKAVAVGYSSSAESSAVAIGDTATAAENAIAIGKETEAAKNAVAIGKNTKASVEGSIALGKDSQAIRPGGITGWDPKTGTTSTKSGTAWVSGAGALSIGNGGTSRQITNVAAGSEDSDAVNLAQLKEAMTHYYSVKTTAETDAAGNNNYLNDGATGDNALAAGVNANASGKNATAVGYNTTAPYERATAMGAFANATSSQATAIGSSASATSSQSTAIGYNAGAHGTYATAVGSSASATSYESTAIGSGAGAHGSYAIAMGNGASATSSQATALGNGASATSSQATAIGSGAYANSSYGIAIGNGASAQYGDYNIAIGNGTSAQNSSYNIAIGNGASAQNGYGTALGYNAKTTAPNGTALGSGASAYYYATALGNNATASSSYALAAGDGANAQVYQAIALGYNAKSYVTGGVALGSSSTANVASGKTGLDPHTGAASTNTGTTWVSTLGAVSVGTVDSDGNATGTRQINGVAAGTQDTDAVNVAQLKAMETRINMHYYSVNSTLSGTGSNYDNSGANGTNAMAAGPAASATAENAVAIGYGAKAEGVGATVIGQYGKATGRYALAFGGQQTDTTAEQANNVASGDNAVSFGERTTASGANATAFGQETKATEKRATAFGQRTQATQSNATAFGINTLASGQNATAFGNLTQATAIGATAFGNKNQATGQYATAWGGGDKKVDNGDGTTKKVGTVASGTYATAFGERTVASGESATAFGSDSTASGKNALAFGENSTAEGENSLAALGGTVAKDAANGAAIGKDAQAKLADTVALGSGSVADRQSGTKGYDAATGAETTQASATWVANANAIAVGNGSTLTRQITGVAAGSLDTDAVNLAQLKEVGKLAGKHTTVSVGGTHATADNTVVNGGNLEMTRTTSNGQANYDVSLNKDIVLGQQEENKGGSITVNSVGTFRKYDDQGNHTDYPMKEAVKIDGTTISVVKHDGSDGDNDQRQVVIGVGQDTGGYVALYDNTGKKPTYIFNAISPGITYLKDNATYPDDANEFGRLEYGDIYNGSTQFIATLDDGLKFSGDQGTMSAVKLNQKLSITGGVTDADSLSTGNNIGVVSSQDGNNGKLELKLNKDLTGLNTVTAGTAKIGNHPADTLKFTQNGQVTETTAPAGDYVTGLDNKYWDTANPSYVSGRAATEDQLAAVSGTINKGLSFTTNTKDTGNTSDNYTGYKVVNRKLGDTISIKAGDADPDMKYVTTNLTSQIAENGDITISMAESPTFNIVTATSVNLNPKDTTTKDQAGNTASARLDAHYRDASLNPEKNVTMADGNTGMVRLHYHDGEGTIHDLATMDDGQIYAGDIKEDGTEDTTGFGRRMNQKTIINGGVKEKDKLTDNNIGVLSNGTDTLTVKLAKNLTKLESVQAGKTTIDDKGLTIRKSDDDSSKNVIVLGDQVAFGDNQVNNMGSGASKITKDDKGNETYEYNTLNNGANIGDVKNIASSTVQPVIDTVNKGWELDVNGTKQKAVTPDSPKVNLIQGQNITITGDTTNTENVTIATADDVRFNTVRVGGSKTDTDYTGGIVIGKQSGGASANPDENDYITGLKNTNWDSNKIQSGRAATEDQLQAVATEIKNGTVKGDVYVTGGAVSYKGEGEGADPKANDGTGSINLTRQNGTDVHIDGLHDYYVTGGTVTDDGTKLELTRNDRDSSGNPQKITVDLSNVLSNDLHLVQNPAEGSEGKYKVDPSTGTVTLKVQNADGTKSSDITIGGFEGLGQGLRFGANKMAKDGGGNPVTNQLGSTINITGAGTKELKDYSGKNLLTSVEQDDQGNTIVHVLMDKNISADGVTVGQAGKDGVAGADGEIGQAGTIGINGKNGVTGDDGKEGITTTVIHTEKGQPGENGATGKPGVDGKDITRIVYQNDQDQVDGKDGSHTVATLDDGLKFSGDDNRVIKKKLNEQLQFVGGADKAKLTQNNIGINELEDGKLTIQLVNTPDLGAKGNLKAGDAHIGWFDGDALNMTKDGTNPSGNKAAAGSYATGLSNTDWNVTDPEYVSGRAATEDQLAKVSAAINNATAAAGKRTVVTVNDKANPDGAEPNSQVGAYGDYSSQNGNLMIAAKKDDEGQMTYNIKLNDQLAIGKKSTPGQDGTDGKFTVETSKGTTMVIGHDGEPGQDGKDGISVKGQDGKDGVTLSVTNGKDGEDGSEGHIGLTGPKGKDGKDASADIHVKNGQNGVDGTDGNKGKDGMDRIVYEDHNGKTHEVATLDDGLKFVGNDGQKVTRKLNETLSIKGGLDKDAVATASSKNLGVRSNEKGDGLEIVMTDTPDFTKVTVGGDKKITIGGQTNSDTKNPANGNYITGLDNTQWDKDHVTENRAATEGQLKEAINEISGKDKGGFGLAAETGGSVKQDLGGSIAIKGDTTYKEDGTTVDKKGNIKTSVDNGAIKVELNKDVDLGQDGSVKAGNTTINKDGVDTNKVTIKDSTISISKDGINAGDKQITNVQSGGDVGTNAANIDDVKRIAGNMKTEINNNVTEVTNKVNQMGDELTQVKQDVKADRQYLGDEGTDKKVNVKFGSALSLTGGAQVDNLAGEGNIGVIQKEMDDPDHAGQKINGLSIRLAKDLTGLNSVTTGNTTINNGGLTVKTGDANRTITVQDGNVNMGGNQIHNVAPGTAPTDAVNVSQLQQTGRAINQLGSSLDKLGTRVDRVGANSAALAALHPLDFDPDDKLDFAVGAGNYSGANAVALGAFYRPNEDVMISLGGSTGGGENMVNLGATFKLGQHNHVSNSRVAMAKEIRDLKALVARQDGEMQQLKTLMNQLAGKPVMRVDKDALFPDIPENHWAYEYVIKLARAGIIEGYEDGQFKGDRMMTRYEFAALLYRAIMAGAAANPDLNQDGTLGKLVKEFDGELKYIRIDVIEKDKHGKPTIERVRTVEDSEKHHGK